MTPEDIHRITKRKRRMLVKKDEEVFRATTEVIQDEDVKVSEDIKVHVRVFHTVTITRHIRITNAD